MRTSRRRMAGTARFCAAVLLLASLSSCAHFVVLNDPLSASEHNDLGVAYESTGQLDLAAREYHHALRLEPHDTQARVNLGNVEAARGKWSTAESCYRRALLDSSTNLDAMNNLAVALLKQSKGLNEARSLAERAVAAGAGRDSIYRATLAELNASHTGGR